MKFLTHIKKLLNLNKENRKKLIQELKRKHRFVIMDTETYQEKFSFRLSGINLFITVGISAIALIVITSVLIVFTPLREYIPGYTQIDLIQQSYENTQKVDSLETIIHQQMVQMNIIKSIISGKTPNINDIYNEKGDYSEIELEKLKKEFESNPIEIESTQALNGEKKEKKDYFRSYFFFNPLRGKILNGFDPKSRHWGVDIVGKENDVVKSVYDGTVIFSNWTIETGHVIAIQHSNNIVSIYKHNSSLLKKIGEIVRAGDPIAFIGNSGELTSGTHLHFELWFDGIPINPSEYIVF